MWGLYMVTADFQHKWNVVDFTYLNLKSSTVELEEIGIDERILNSLKNWPG